MSTYEIMDSFGKIKIEPKDKIIERLGESPDRAEALLLAFHDPYQVVSFPSQSMNVNLLSGVSAEPGGYGDTSIGTGGTLQTLQRGLSSIMNVNVLEGGPMNGAR